MKTLIACLSAVASVFFSGVSAEKANADIEAAVRRLGADTKIEDLATLRVDPLLAVTLLVKQVRPISETKILRDERQLRPEEMRVIWSIRALRYLTGLDFTAKTQHRFQGSNDEDRAQFLRLKNREVAFFGVWMSRDSIFIAPEDAQRVIVQKWKKWAKSDARNHKFRPPKDIDQWYF